MKIKIINKFLIFFLNLFLSYVKKVHYKLILFQLVIITSLLLPDIAIIAPPIINNITK